MTTEKPAVDETEQRETLTDPVPITGEHPGGPRASEPPFSAIAEDRHTYLEAFYERFRAGWRGDA